MHLIARGYSEKCDHCKVIHRHYDGSGKQYNMPMKGLKYLSKNLRKRIRDITLEELREECKSETI